MALENPTEKIVDISLYLDEKKAKRIREALEKMDPEKLEHTVNMVKKIAATREAISRTSKVADLLDSKGLDPIIGLLPGADVIPMLISAYIVGEALKIGMPPKDIIKMLANIGIDTGVGMIPVLGDIFDFFFKSNKKNVEIIKRHLAKLEAQLPPEIRKA